MSIKEDLKKITSINECSLYMKSTLKTFTTLYSKVYSDYEGKDFTKQIKAYQRGNFYIVTITNINNNKITDMNVCLTNTKPKTPHPVFPIKESFAPNSITFTYK